MTAADINLIEAKFYESESLSDGFPISGNFLDHDTRTGSTQWLTYHTHMKRSTLFNSWETTASDMRDMSSLMLS